MDTTDNAFNTELKGTVAIITGAGGGIGEALAYELERCGATNCSI
ncbi:hypothetical protein HALO59_170184 [Halomonas sp. 59]|jgi:NAD(P)-dependent dehydrogenase (short-subunit alcohol dehydrogenase family)|nr:hypothetical protein HALO156_10207 [Halomonas sp. 156]CAD5265596.1 hypothetical protein HALO113_161021 [Halomonas sp. 113]CAD5267630.1 hypothetical protein HALO59_170184 [Halomonas sp. 59]CAD5280254.1 hypothetical protein HALOI3_210365 [Halomonas sp. I3]VXB62494.1 hypothetical protein HALO98_170366 [Halomonas titanicae]